MQVFNFVSDVVMKTQHIKSQAQAALTQAGNLFNGLLQQVFT